MAKNKIEREYESKGLSAHPEWWAEIEKEAADLGLNRSAFIRMAVNEYLKAEGANVEEKIPQAA
jgi:hypothetical protein